MTKYSEVHLKNCLLIQYCSISKLFYCLVGLVDRVLMHDMGGPWIKSLEKPFFQYRDKTSEYSEIYSEQLTSEHFLPYNYRSSTLPRISRNIGRLLRQCMCRGSGGRYPNRGPHRHTRRAGTTQSPQPRMSKQLTSHMVPDSNIPMYVK